MDLRDKKHGTEHESLSREELNKSIVSIVELYKRAYEREIPCDISNLVENATQAGFLLRTKIRAVIEALDQIYQYGDIGEIETAKIQAEDISEVLNSYFDITNED